MLRLRVCAVIATLGLVVTALTAARPADTAPPVDFTDTLVANVLAPTALAFTPDGRMLITTQPGQVRVLSGGSLLSQAAIDLSSEVCTGEEQGLLGVTTDPSFGSNRYVYLYYTHDDAGTCENRVSRFTMSGDTLSPATELVLVDGIPSPAGIHNGGDLHFGNDGYLYVSVGDGGCDYLGDSGCGGANDASRDQNVLVGKILRVTATGGIPPTNPYQAADSARCNVTGRTTPGKKCQETYAWGLRNPFRMAFDPNTTGTRFFINDVGQNAWEEIDLGQAGADYGWNVREGHCCGTKPAGMTDPIFDYSHDAGCAAITGGAFVPNGVWPSAYDGAYVYADYVCGQLFLLKQNGGLYSSSTFATGNGAPVEVAFGPYGATQALYYTNYNSGGEIRRIAYTGSANRPPTATITASPSSGPAPLTTTLDASGSRDPDAGDTISFRWSFGDGSATVQTQSATTQHVYSTAGTYTASVVAVDNHGAASPPATVRIDPGNSPPVPSINAPTASFRFKVGETIQLRGSATDPEDGALPGTSLSWTVIRHHATHTHPFLAPTPGSTVTIVGPEPEDAAAAANSYLEVQLTATDSRGLARTTSLDLQPAKVNVTLATNPAGLRLELFGQPPPAPTFVAWQGWQLTLNAPDQVDGSGKGWAYSSWSDGGARSHTVVVAATDATYTASFVPGPAQPAGLVAGYGFDENTGTTVADVSGNANAGTTSGTTWTAGKFGSALSFDGSSSRVTVPDSGSLDLTRALTLEAWVKPTSISSWRSVAMKERTGGILYSLYASESTGHPVGQVDIGGEQNASGLTGLALNTWTHLASTWDGTTLRLYVNGQQAASKAVTGTLATSTAPFRIGGNGIWGEYFAGSIDEVRLYDHALTATEIQADMNRPVGAVAGDTQPPIAPGTPSATVSGTSVSLSWPAATDTGSGVARYRVHRSTTSGFTPDATNQIATSTTTSYGDTGLAAGTYFYKVVAEDGAGNVGPASAQASATIQAAPPPPTGLVAAYGFDENTGTTVADASGKGNTGITTNTTWAAGKFGSALSFDGVSSRVNVADSSSLDLTRSLTLEAWVKPSSLSRWASIAMKERTGGIVYSLYANDAADHPVGQVDTGAEQNAAGTAKLPLNVWSHLAVTWDGATLRLYLNGVQVGSKAVAATLAASTGPFRIGGNAIWGEYFNGVIDEVRLYDRALSATEIQADMQRAVASAAAPASAQPAAPGGPVAAYNFDETSGTTLHDASGIGNSGTASGGPTWVAGHTAGALSFDGVDDVVAVPGTTSLALTTGMTVEAWVKPSQLGSSWRTIALKERPGGMCYALYAHDGNGAAGHVVTGSESVAKGAALTLDAWTHLAVTYDGSVVALYRDGALVSSTFASGELANGTGALKIGGNSIWFEPFAGLIDDLRIYNRPLSATEIAGDMQRPV